MSHRAVEVEDLRVTIGNGAEVVCGVSFHLDEGEIVGLVGESGSGKTTTGLALLGHSRRGATIAGGSVRLDGSNILGLGRTALRRLRGARIAYVAQDPASALNPALRIGLQLSETLEAHGMGADTAERRARISELLAEVGLPDADTFLARYPHQLSGGQQQRIGLAMAFACRPSVIVLDEPTTGLDVTTQAHVLASVRELCRAHRVAALYITHDLAVVAEVADRVLVMYSGRIVESGPQETVFRASAHPYTARLIRAVPDLRDRRGLLGIPGHAPGPGARPEGCSFAPRCELAEDACREAVPPPLPVGPGHRARCIRWEVVRRSAGHELGKAPPASASPSAATPLLRVDGVSAWHGAQEVLRDVAFELRHGECLAVVGESGSGKTTLARSLAGIHEGFRGVVEFDGRPLPAGSRRRDPETRRRIQYVFQNPYGSLNPRWSVGQIVEQPLRLFFSIPAAERRERVVAALERVSLSARFANRHPDQLSGGERQRVAIARAIAADPALLICDEVTSALDVSVQAAIVELLESLRRDLGVGLLFITHNLALVRSIAQRAAVISDGRIVELASAAEVLDNPRDEYTRRLLVNTPSPAASTPAAVTSAEAGR